MICLYLFLDGPELLQISNCLTSTPEFQWKNRIALGFSIKLRVFIIRHYLFCFVRDFICEISDYGKKMSYLIIVLTINFHKVHEFNGFFHDFNSKSGLTQICGENPLNA